MTPNGIGLSPDGKTLYFAETEAARLWAFDVQAPGRSRQQGWPSPHGARMVAAAPGGHYQRFDSLAVDAFGNICVATLIHGGISVVVAGRQPCSHVPLPDLMTTNLCFGGQGPAHRLRHPVGQRQADRDRRLAGAGARAELQRLNSA